MPASWCEYHPHTHSAQPPSLSLPHPTHAQVVETGTGLYSVDVDESHDLTLAYGASQLPLFVFLKKGKKVLSLVGAQNTALRNKILKLASS